MAVSHVYSNTNADATGTLTIWNGATTSTVAATNLVRPSDWNSAHNQFITLTGETIGQSTVSGTNIVFGGTNGVAVSVTSNTIFFAEHVMSGYNPYPDRSYQITNMGNGTLIFDPEHFPHVAFDRVAIPVHHSNATNSSGTVTLSFWVGLYTKNASTLSLWGSTSSSSTAQQSGTVGSYSIYSGIRLFTIPWTTTFPGGDVVIGMLSRTTSGGANATFSNLGLSNIASNFVGIFGASNNTTQQFTIGQGVYTATTSSLPNSVAYSQIRGSDSAALRPPMVLFPYSTV